MSELPDYAEMHAEIRELNEGDPLLTDIVCPRFACEGSLQRHGAAIRCDHCGEVIGDAGSGPR